MLISGAYLNSTSDFFLHLLYNALKNSSQHFSISTQTPPFHLSLFAFANLEANIPLFESDEWRGSDFNSESKNSGAYSGENDSEESIQPLRLRRSKANRSEGKQGEDSKRKLL